MNPVSMFFVRTSLPRTSSAIPIVTLAVNLAILPTSVRKGKPTEVEEQPTFDKPAQKPFIFLQVTALREYLRSWAETAKQVSFTFNLERAIDDWIFLLLLCGKWLLPHLPSLELREGAIDILLKIYKELQGQLGGYICDGGRVNLERAQQIMQGLAKVETDHFWKRQLQRGTSPWKYQSKKSGRTGFK